MAEWAWSQQTSSSWKGVGGWVGGWDESMPTYRVQTRRAAARESTSFTHSYLQPTHIHLNQPPITTYIHLNHPPTHPPTQNRTSPKVVSKIGGGTGLPTATSSSSTLILSS